MTDQSEPKRYHALLIHRLERGGYLVMERMPFSDRPMDWPGMMAAFSTLPEALKFVGEAIETNAAAESKGKAK